MARIFPESLDGVIGASEVELNSSAGSVAAGAFSDPWFCPVHTCVGCHALQTSQAALALCDVPSTLVARQNLAVQRGLHTTPNPTSTTSAKASANSVETTRAAQVNGCAYPKYGTSKYSLRRKELRTCSTCPFAVCGDCEDQLSDRKGLFQMRRFAEVGNESLVLSRALNTVYV